ncbi:UNVERIFIED_CONTAM: hypothetical protein Sradi_1565700 [Sesamum radiatum]|uniref:Uncharacterized protein n=1 Tax=Sesamum radiatum TaxID=300843 RepID=A0AAW2UBB1_SESRA
MVIEKGIKVNPDKIYAIQEIKAPANLNEVQKLAGRIVTLSRTTIKAQTLVGFMNKTTYVEDDEGKWFLHVDGSSIFVGSGAKIVLTSPKGHKLEYALMFDFKSNETEYEAFIAGTKMALDAGARNLTT